MLYIFQKMRCSQPEVSYGFFVGGGEVGEVSGALDFRNTEKTKKNPLLTHAFLESLQKRMDSLSLPEACAASSKHILFHKIS